jgi:hypothetical protein
MGRAETPHRTSSSSDKMFLFDDVNEVSIWTFRFGVIKIKTEDRLYDPVLAIPIGFVANHIP